MMDIYKSNLPFFNLKQEPKIMALVNFSTLLLVFSIGFISGLVAYKYTDSYLAYRKSNKTIKKVIKYIEAQNNEA